MYDRFDYLELTDEKPALLPEPDETETPRANGTGWAPPARLRAVEVIGDPGTKAGQFASPTSLAVDPWGAVYVTDSGNHRVQRITSNGNVMVIGRPGNQQGQIWGPQGVAVDPTGHFVYVAEQGNNRVQCFRYDNGQSQGVIGGLRMPGGVAFDSEGLLWIADTGNGRVLRADVKAGKFVSSLDRQPGMNKPSEIACGPAGSLFVTDSAASDVVCFSKSGARTHALSQIRRLAGPRQCAIDSEGRIYLTESDANRLHVFDSTGSSLFIFQLEGGKLGALKGPSGVAIGPSGEVYLADTLNHRVLRLAWER